PLGTVRVGRGNNGKDGTEGAIHRNAIGCYLHGSLLPKNPVLADWLIAAGLEHRHGSAADLDPLDDRLEQSAHANALGRAVATN
ncbi:MAG TPA: glutamine amidotransferase, partial [Thermomicrobiales bacterium]|nr:glutamine amidotransferase [Thermomicrobiales bacterium]